MWRSIWRQEIRRRLEPGCRTLYLCEFLLAEFAGRGLSYAVRTDTGLRQVVIEGGKSEPRPKSRFW